MKQKIYDDPKSALDGLLFEGMTIMSGGFGLSGNPESLIPEIRASGVTGLTVISNNAGADGFGLWMLLEPADQEDDLVLCRREQAFRAAISLERAGARAQPAGHARRAHPGRRRGYPGVLHQDGGPATAT